MQNEFNGVSSMKDNLLKNNSLLYIVSFLVPAVILTIVYAKLGFYPFGEKTVLIMDMQDQYCEFFSSLKDIFRGENTLFFSWSRSMGGNYLGLFAYYLASPLSFITLFFSVETLPVALFFLTIIKTGLCGLTFSLFLQHTWKETRDRKLLNVVFSSCYALMTYAVVYGMCLMWLDGLIFLPLVLLGIEKILQGKKGLLYLLALAGIFISNYYTAYMIGIFSAIYIVFRVFCMYEKGAFKKYFVALCKFAGNTFMAFGLAAPLLLPTIKDLLVGKLNGSEVVSTETYTTELFYLIDKLFGGYDSITFTGKPSIFCGMVMIVLAVLFFFMKKISWKEKLGSGLIFSLLIASFWLYDLNVAWHGFLAPTWFPFRYAFLFCTFMIITAYKAMIHFEFSLDFKKKISFPVAAYLIGIVIIFQFVELYNNASAQIVGLDGQFRYKTMEEYRGYVDEMSPIVDSIKEKDSGFYRMEQDHSLEFSKNDSMLLGYNGMTHYSSTYHGGVNLITSKLGLAQAHIWNSGYGSSVFTDSIFSVKYRMMESEMPDSYEKIDENGSIVTYENKMALPIMFASEKFELLDFSDVCNFENQNTLLKELTGENEQFFKPLEYEKHGDTTNWGYVFTATGNHPVYLRMIGNEIAACTVTVDGKEVGHHFTSESNCNLYLGQFKKGEKVTVIVTSSSATLHCTDEWIYELDMEKFTQAYKKLDAGGLQIIKQEGSSMEGTITVGEEQMIFTSIPYSEGFTVELDGKEAEIRSLKVSENGQSLDTFVLIPAEAGEHTVKISYCPPGFTAGCMLFVVGVAVIGLYYGFDKIKQLLWKQKERIG